MIRRFAKPLSLAVLPLAVSGALVSCSSDDSDAGGEDTASQEALQNPPASDAPADLILDDASTPDGYTFEPAGSEGDEDLSELFGGEMEDSGDIVTPPQCEPLAVDLGLVLQWSMEPADATAVASFVQDQDDESGVFVRVTTGTPEGGMPDVAGCGEFSSESNSEFGSMSKSFQATPVDVSVDGVDDLAAADITVTGLLLDGEDVGAEAVGQTARYITGALGDRTFNFLVVGQVDDEVVEQLAADQVARMNSVAA
ncbi:hypothetical protein BJF89_04775 [Corynebacterium sp. CNJ-954]|uniref:hypothetical protein n=1 Tax=Corynebacterium sp. CNJ-954 TaxID=1904962 RepID=UPI000960D32A|nr:hypothetical protein [Corynebacterium sp. CNJ-954]OLT52775.1 hypothetical protein BJF89_04775 [Corynebacterium sp. CNJ-954]